MSVDTSLEFAEQVEESLSVNCSKKTCTAAAVWLAVGECGCDALRCQMHKAADRARIEQIASSGRLCTCNFCGAYPLAPTIRWVPL